MTIEVHQLLSNLDYGDAISNQAIELRGILRSRGYGSNIYARYIHPRMNSECYFYREHSKRSSGENVVIFHHSIASEVSDYILGLPDKKIMVYHNITPGRFFLPFDRDLAYLLKKGREELKNLAGVPFLALGDSGFNAEELRALGYRNVDTLPIIIDRGLLSSKPDQGVMGRYNDGKTNVLFVGRVVPNKRFEDIIKAFYFYQRHINRSSRLLLVGSYKNLENYHAALAGLVKRLGLEDVVFAGHVTQSELNAYYRSSHLFLCMSEHEGFCVPLVEAMHFNLPVLAFASSAVPETLGNGGILFREKRYEEVAELMDLVLTDEDIRRKITEAQKIKLKDFDGKKIGELFISHIEAVRAS
ncbi:MAG: glycosyltransferase family 4 protein [Deltaproteobacteria bacterium]|nr:glycosyltransferase family 4 protein [Deltaproteobacteria bacterium]